MPVFAFILLGILMLAFAGIALFFFLLDHRDKYYRYEDDELISGTCFNCEFKHIGGSMNEHTTIEIIYNGDSTANLLYSSTPYNGAKTKKKDITVPKEIVDELRGLYRKHCIPVLADCLPRDEFALDAPTLIATFSSKNKSYSVSSEQELPEKSRGVFDELYKLLMSYVD